MVGGVTLGHRSRSHGGKCTRRSGARNPPNFSPSDSRSERLVTRLNHGGQQTRAKVACGVVGVSCAVNSGHFSMRTSSADRSGYVPHQTGMILKSRSRAGGEQDIRTTPVRIHRKRTRYAGNGTDVPTTGSSRCRARECQGRQTRPHYVW